MLKRLLLTGFILWSSSPIATLSYAQAERDVDRVSIERKPPLTAIGLLNLGGDRICTAWMASACHAVSNGHCAPIKNNKGSVVQFIDFRGNKWRAETVFDGGMGSTDFAILRLNKNSAGKNAGDVLGVLQVEKIDHHALLKEKPSLCMIGFPVDRPDNNGRNATLSKNVEIQSADMDIPTSSPGSIYYAVTSVGGNSGSPLLRCIPPRDGSSLPIISNMVVAVHAGATNDKKSRDTLKAGPTGRIIAYYLNEMMEEKPCDK